jgi:prevent-host-death family protein
MIQVNIHEAKTNLSKLVNKAVSGESFVIAKDGKPMVWVTAYSEEGIPRLDVKRRVGFMKGMCVIPENFPESFDRMMEDEIIEMFEDTI